MTLLDSIVLFILLVSILVGMLRGLVGEIFALLGWIIGFFAAGQLSPLVMKQITGLPPFMSGIIAFSSVLIMVLVVMRLISLLLSRLVKWAGLAWLNLGLGAFFGLIRGLIIVLIATLFAGMTPLPQHPMWRNAIVKTPVEYLATKARSFLPSVLADRIHY